MSNISKQRLMELSIPIPPIELQNQFADFVKQVDKLKFEFMPEVQYPILVLDIEILIK